MNEMQTARPAPPRVLLIVAVALIGLNLRPFLTAIGPLTLDIREATGLDYQHMSFLTLVPMALMGLCAFAGPSLQRIVGARASMIGALVVLVIGCALRLVTANGAALIGTAALCGFGVAIVQAVFPGIIKAQFPDRLPVVMGLYSSALMGGGAVGAQLSPLIASATGSWQIGLGGLAVPAVLAVLLAAWALPRAETHPAQTIHTGSLLRRPRTWLLMVCFGLVNGGYSSAVAWLAPYYQEIGWTTAASGGLLAILAASQAAAALAIPAMAARQKDRRAWIWLTIAMQLIGFAGLILSPQSFAIGWSILLGAGLGGCFALSMVVALDHLDDPTDAGSLSALMQGGGFLIAAIPPWIVAMLHDLTGSFIAGWLMHLCAATLVAILTLRFAPDGYAGTMAIAPATQRAASAGMTP